MRRIALAAALTALSVTAPAEAMTCKEVSSKILNEMAPASGTTEYRWRAIERKGREILTDAGCDPITSGFNVGASGMRLDNMLYGGPDPGGY